ncbi:MAG: RNA polymerase sigma factor [Anaerolineales bacterium]|nr:RNA polymerase sigma factor [Anaerolineales bacterium]
MNRAAFHQLYVRHASDVYRFALWLSGNPAEADDITSETFVRAWAGRSKIRTETVKAYLFAIARNLFLQQQRQQKRQVGLEQAETIPAAERPSDIVEQRQGWEDLAQQLQRLPESDRAALILRAQYQMAYAEIARVLNISLSAAKVKVHRARLKLTAIRAAEEATNQ